RLLAAGVPVDVVLAGKAPDVRHDVVGDLAQQLRVALSGRPVGVVQRRTHPYPDGVAQPRQLRTDRLHLVRVDHRDRNDRYLRLQGDAGDAGVAPVQLPVRGTGALGVDTEQAAVVEYLQRDVQRVEGRPAVAALHRDLPDAAEEGGRHPALE